MAAGPASAAPSPENHTSCTPGRCATPSFPSCPDSRTPCTLPLRSFSSGPLSLCPSVPCPASHPFHQQPLINQQRVAVEAHKTHFLNSAPFDVSPHGLDGDS